MRAVRQNRGHDVSRALMMLGVELIDELDEPLDLADLRGGTGLKMPDCCALDAAARADATLASVENRLISAARTIGVDVIDGEDAMSRPPRS